MRLNELNEFVDLNELDLLYKIIEFAESEKKDLERVLRGEKAAGIRVRSKLQDVKILCEIIRDKIQIRKGIKRKENKISVLEKVIKQAQKKQIKDKELIEKKKRERVARLFR
jgi:hypothetical protein